MRSQRCMTEVKPNATIFTIGTFYAILFWFTNDYPNFGIFVRRKCLSECTFDVEQSILSPTVYGFFVFFFYFNLKEKANIIK